MNSFPYLSFLIWLPILAGLGIALAPKLNIVAPRSLSILVAVGTLVISGFVVVKFLGGEAGFLLKQDVEWIPAIGVSYLVGVDSMAA